MKMKTNKKFLAYSRLPTEQNNPRTRDLDRIPLKKVLEKLNYEDALVHKAVRKAIPGMKAKAGPHAISESDSRAPARAFIPRPPESLSVSFLA